MAEKTFQESVGAPPDRVFAAAERAIDSLKYKVTESDPDSGVIAFKTGMSMRSWAGQAMRATIAAGPDGSSTVTVEGDTAKIGAYKQPVAWGETQKVATKFLDALRSGLG